MSRPICLIFYLSMFRQRLLDSLLGCRRILIAGYGREGRSTHALLQRITPLPEITVARDDEGIIACLEESRRCGREYDLVVKSPGIPMMKLEGRCNLEKVTSQSDLFLQVFGDMTVGVTGTKGKSTTTALLGHVLASAMPSRQVLVAGNMGIPLFDVVDQMNEGTMVVAEFSCHQLENIHRGPHIGVVLNLYQEHLDHYHDYRGYGMAKLQMMLRQQQGDHCFYCTDSADLVAMVSEFRSEVVSSLHAYSLREARQSDVASMPTRLQGDHNLCNIFAVREVTSLMGVSSSCFAEALASFQGLPHRLEQVGTFRGITFYNDSISTIPEATMAALQALPQTHTLILGGFDRGIDYSPLAVCLAARNEVGNLVFVGKAGRRMIQEWQGLSPNPLEGRNVLLEDDYAKIVAWCFAHTQRGKVCLLSPAAASYDSFTNFEHRGNTFKELILKNE